MRFGRRMAAASAACIPRVATTILAVLISTAACAADGASCARIDNAGERLLCYDGVFRTAVANETQTVESKWVIQTETSKIDDSKSVFLGLESDDDFPGKFGNGRRRANLTLRCMENSTSAILLFGDHFMADTNGYGDVTFRVDNQPAFTRGLDESTDHMALGLWNGGSAIPFIKKLFDGKTLVVRATPFSESPITATFTIAGLKEKIASLREACKW